MKKETWKQKNPYAQQIVVLMALEGSLDNYFTNKIPLNSEYIQTIIDDLKALTDYQSDKWE
jgi:hypothetical protein